MNPLFKQAYSQAIGQGCDNVTAIEVAKRVMRKKYRGAWRRKVAGKSAVMRMTVIKSGWFFPDYKFHMVLTDDQWDETGERATADLLERKVREGKVDRVGDVDHERICKEENRMGMRSLLTEETDTEGLYYLDKYQYHNGKLEAVVGMNKNHKHYKDFVKKHKKGEYLYASAEFFDPIYNDFNEIVDCSRIGFTITDNPLNDRAGVVNVVA